MKRRGQASTEYLFLIAIILIVFIPVLFYSINKVANELKVAKLTELVSSLGEGIKHVYALGPGNLEVVTVNIPTGMRSVSISGPEIIFIADIYGQQSEIVILAPTSLSGNLSVKPGLHNILVNSTDGSIVRVMDKEFLQ